MASGPDYPYISLIIYMTAFLLQKETAGGRPEMEASRPCLPPADNFFFIV